MYLDRYGFPLIYVNHYFEKISGYKREDIMGVNCKFLQRDGRGNSRSETESVERLSHALRSAETVKVALTNFRKDGTPFKNLLTMKPVFDMRGEYEYVIGVQFDISSKKSSAYALRLVDSLVKFLPSVVTF
jgi:PAS domain S-box-containing protein